MAQKVAIQHHDCNKIHTVEPRASFGALERLECQQTRTVALWVFTIQTGSLEGADEALKRTPKQLEE